MSKRDELIAKYALDLKEKLGVTPDLDLLKKVVIGCGPSIYNADAETVAASDKSEIERVKESYLKKKLGLPEGPELLAAINDVVEKYGSSNRHKYRAVIYYQLCVHFKKQSVYA